MIVPVRGRLSHEWYLVIQLHNYTFKLSDRDYCALMREHQIQDPVGDEMMQILDSIIKDTY